MGTIGDREPTIDRSPTDRRSEIEPNEVVVDLTTELRWFFDGPLPPAVLRWFTASGAGLAEDRCDTYRLDRHVDTGVKRRFRTTLELKRRLGTPEPFATRGVNGNLEVWKRWSPADGRVDIDDSTTWVDVDKTVIKRRFDRRAREMPLSEEGRAMSGDGCDVEIAVISVNGLQAWTFALAAFGQPEHQRALLVSTWDALAMGRSDIKAIGLDSRHSSGYPEWLARVASPMA